MVVTLAPHHSLWAATDPRVERLLEDLGSPKAAVRTSAAERLLALGPAASAAVLEAAASPNIVVAVPAKDLLPAFGPAAIEALVEAGTRDYALGNRRWDLAKEAVARMGTPAVAAIV
jgi:HEAT repeat protein